MIQMVTRTQRLAILINHSIIITTKKIIEEDDRYIPRSAIILILVTLPGGQVLPLPSSNRRIPTSEFMVNLTTMNY